MTTSDPILARWQAIVAERDPEAAKDWGDEPWSHFLHVFRPDGTDLERLFDGMPHGAGVLGRLRRVFEVAGDPGRGHAYFVPQRRPAVACGVLAELARRHLDALGAIAELLDARGPQACALITRDVEVEVVRTPVPRPDRAEPNEMTSLAYELITEFGRSLPPASKHGEYLRDPLYYLANDYALAYHVLWPHIGGGAAIDEPFAAYFELWCHGASIEFAGSPLTLQVHFARTIDECLERAPLAIDDDPTGIDLAWNTIERLGVEIRRGAKRADVADLEEAIGRPLWASLRTSLARHDGTFEESEQLGGLELLGASQIATAWQLSCAGGPGRWVPIAAGDGRFVCLDRSGRVVETDEDFEQRPRVIAPSYAAWLTALAGSTVSSGDDEKSPTASTRPVAPLTRPAKSARDTGGSGDPVKALLERLVADGRLELSARAEVAALARLVEEALDRGGDMHVRGARVHAALLDSPLVDELYLSEAELALVLAKEHP